MSYRLPVNEAVRARLKFVDLVGSPFGAQLRAKAIIDGSEQIVYLPGSGSDALSAFHRAGVIAQIPASYPEPTDSKGIELPLVCREVVFEVVKPNAKARAQLMVTCNGAARATAAAPPASTPAAPPTGAAPSAIDGRDVQRATTTAAFRAALEASFAELVPVFAQNHVAVDGDVAYRLGFSLFAAWREKGLA